ncbi:MAG: energy transducer TonB [Brevundimonas sp.]|jgi:periplasmic protein TonB|uniref:energy transducer TonB n=1 Tax=Brevundimonas sp. TaxID=1871086 RepID=UPI003918B6FB
MLPSPLVPALLAALALGGQPAAETASPPEPQPTMPRVLGNVQYQDVTLFYPPLAMAEDVQGVGIVECWVSEAGRFEDCRVVSESPEGYGFGEATIRLVSRYELEPARLDGVPVRFGPVRQRIIWELR